MMTRNLGKRAAAVFLALALSVSLCCTEVNAGSIMTEPEEMTKEAVEMEKRQEAEDAAKKEEITENKQGKLEKTTKAEQSDGLSSKNLDDATEDPVTKEDNPVFTIPQLMKEVEKETPAVKKGSINYTYVDEGKIETPQQQNIVISVGTIGNKVSDAVLFYHNQETGESFQQKATETVEDALLFSIQYHSKEQSGIYHLDSVSYNIEETPYAITMEEAQLDICYGVNREVQTKPDAMVIDDELEMEVVTYDEVGNQVSQDSIADALANAESTVEASGGAVAKTRGNNLVVVLDPGHGGTDPGACRSYNGINYYERDIVLKIANFCKAELETYNGVTVYMTRTDNTSPLMDRWQRSTLAQSLGANVVVSLHINSTGEEVTSASGSLVYCPENDNAVGSAAHELASQILSKLSSLGLQNRGNVVDESLGMTRYPKQLGFPGILVEHAFVNNPNDVANYFSSDEKLRKLGVADAAGIAQYYGLAKGLVAPPPTTITRVKSISDTNLEIAWSKTMAVAGYQLYRSEQEVGKYKKIAVINSKEKYVDTGLEKGKTYYYKVRPYRYMGSTYAFAPFSAVFSGKTVDKAVISKVQSQADGKLLVEWNKVAGAYAYQVQRSTSSNGTYKKIATIKPGSTTSYLDRDVKINKKYYYRVQTLNRNGGVTGGSGYGTIKAGKAVGKTKITSILAKPGEKIGINWNKATGASSFAIYRSTSKNGTYKKIKVVKASTTSYLDGDVTPGKRYYYKIEAQNNVGGITGYGGASSPASGIAAAQTSITGVKSKAGGKLTITWEEVSGATGYTIQRSTSKDGTYIEIANISSGGTTSYTDSKLKIGKRYYYRIETRNLVNKKAGSSGYGAAAYGVPIGKTTISYVQSASGGALKVVWKKVSGAAAYQIQRSTSKNGKYERIGYVSSGNTTSYIDQKIRVNKIYYYKVEVINKPNGFKGYGGYSAAVSGKAVAKPVIESLKAGSKSAKITWGKVSGATSYTICRSESKTRGYVKIATVTADKLSYEDKSAKPGKTYFYKIQASNKVNKKTGYSGYCNPMETTILTAVKKPAAVAASDKIKLSWALVPGATGYQIYRSDSANGTFKRIKTVTGQTAGSYQDGKIMDNTTYYYKIRAYHTNQTGNSYGSFSAVITGSSDFETQQ